MFRLLHGLVHCHWAFSARSSLKRSVNETVKRSMPGLTVSAHAWGDYSGERFVVYNPGFTTRRNGVKCVKYICMKLPYVAQQVGNAYFYRLTKIKELSGSLWWMHEGRNLLKPIAGMRAVQPCGPDGSRASLKFGVQSMITDSCYFFSLPRVSI